MGTEGSADAPRWLSQQELDSWMAFNAVLIKLPAAIDAQLQRDAGVTFFEYLVLAGLSDSPEGKLRLTRLAVLANGSISRLSHVFKRLEKRGYVRRSSSSENGRRYVIGELTEEGRKKLTAAAPGHVAMLRSLLVDQLGAHRMDQLRDISLRVLDVLDPDMEFPPFSE